MNYNNNKKVEPDTETGAHNSTQNVNEPKKAFWISFGIAGLTLVVYGAVRFSTEASGLNFIILTALAFSIAALPWISKFRIKGFLEVERAIKSFQTDTRNQIKETDDRLHRNIDAVKSTLMSTLNSLQSQISQQNTIQSSALKSSNIISIGSTLSLVSGDVKAKEFKTNWLDEIGSDARKLVFHETPSAPAPLIERMSAPEDIDYMIVDLGTGNKWLTSRLFIFTVMLMNTREMSFVVFLGNMNGISRKFIGLALAKDVIAGLMAVYPFLERAYNSVSIFGHSPIEKPDPWQSQNMVVEFLKNSEIQQPPEPPPDDFEDWVYLTKSDGTKIMEHAHWLNQDLLSDFCGSSIDYEAWVEDDPDKSRTKKISAIIRRKGRFVAMVDKDLRFKELIDRYSVLEDLAIHVTETSTDSPVSIDGSAA